MLAPSIIALIRTAVPAAIGTAIAYLVNAGLEIDPETQQTLTTALVALSIAGYYALVTFLERKVNPAFGWLLGFAKAPSYNGDGGSGGGGTPPVATQLPAEPEVTEDELEFTEDPH
jgi:hypothetical protein